MEILDRELVQRHTSAILVDCGKNLFISGTPLGLEPLEETAKRLSGYLSWSPGTPLEAQQLAILNEFHLRNHDGADGGRMEARDLIRTKLWSIAKREAVSLEGKTALQCVEYIATRKGEVQGSVVDRQIVSIALDVAHVAHVQWSLVQPALSLFYQQ